VSLERSTYHIYQGYEMPDKPDLSRVDFAFVEQCEDSRELKQIVDALENEHFPVPALIITSASLLMSPCSLI
jgi:hypothetical protein